jgi:phage tail-like protein
MATSARSQSTDFLSSHRFHVTDDGGVLTLNQPSAGFSQVSSPEMNVSAVEYQEGIELYRRKFAGEVSFPSITLSKGVTKIDSSFYKWLRATAENLNYRVNLTIKQFHRDDVAGRLNYAGPDVKPSKTYILYNCIPTRVKMATDFDATSAEISIEEIEVEMEYFRLLNGDVEVAPAAIS